MTFLDLGMLFYQHLGVIFPVTKIKFCQLTCILQQIDRQTRQAGGRAGGQTDRLTDGRQKDSYSGVARNCLTGVTYIKNRRWEVVKKSSSPKRPFFSCYTCAYE